MDQSEIKKFYNQHKGVYKKNVQIRRKDSLFQEFVIDKLEIDDDTVWCHYHYKIDSTRRICDPLDSILKGFEVIPE